jgi:hypothetical protein
VARKRWGSNEISDLRRAVELLEGSNFLVDLTDMLGSKVAKAMKALPRGARKYVDAATSKALNAAAKAAVASLEGSGGAVSGVWTHKAAVALSGAVGGFFSLAGLVFEAPVTTVVMLRSIADIARAESADLADPAVRMQCLTVLAMGGSMDSGEESYYSTRAAFTEIFTLLGKEAPERAGKKAAETLAKKMAQLLSTIVAQIAPRYAPLITEKAIAQSAPIAGAATGALINTVFIHHFQKKARGHFTVLRLESKYGAAEVQKRYKRFVAADKKAR